MFFPVLGFLGWPGKFKGPLIESGRYERNLLSRPSRIHLSAFRPKERWDDWTELDSKAWPHFNERWCVRLLTAC